MRFKRACGTLVHPTSFPSKYGVGDMGDEARQFIHFLIETKQTIWQILPLGPTGYGNSPYASYSAFAGNPILISPDVLIDKGLLTKDEASAAILPSTIRVDYESVNANKAELFKKAFARYEKKHGKSGDYNMKLFIEKNKFWLKDFCLFMACSEHYGKRPWNQWDEELTRRNMHAIKRAEKEHAERIRYHRWLQFEFFNQWLDLKKFANDNGIMIIGDIPIFVDHNSADCWAHSKYFEVDENGDRLLVAGVPPDYFSATGQLWGNPLYKWNILKRDCYSWWIKRFEQMLVMTDAIRVDHFRGFDAYWEVKADAKTAEHGRWVKGPGIELFKSILKELGELPIIAEDLGVITRDVETLRDTFDFPGMKILQFAWGDTAGNSFLPHNYKTCNCVVYTGTHDNDTSRGWYNGASDLEKHRLREYVRSSCENPELELIRLAMTSCANQAIFPLQDLMGLDTEHRMNLPGTVAGNWMWRFTPDMMQLINKEYISYLVDLTNRDPSAGLVDSNLVELETEEAN